MATAGNTFFCVIRKIVLAISANRIKVGATEWRSEMEKPVCYEVKNRITGKVYTFKTSAAASRAVDRMDNAYGAYICTRRAIWA
jgi:hypothetical protein